MPGIALGTAYGQIYIDLSGVNKAVKGFATGMQAIEKNFTTIGKKMSAAGDEMTRGVTLPLVAIGTAAGKMALDFDRSMTHISALVGESEQQVKAWSDQLIDMGPKLGRGPKELADALYFVTSSGIEAGKAMSVVEASAKAASSGLGQTQVIADAVTSAMNAYAKSGLEAGDATGILVAAVREGKGEASELAQSMGRVTPVAAQLGVEFHEVAAAMAAQSLVGFDAAESATNLSGILSAFLKPTKQAADTLATFGLSAEGVRQSLAEDGLLATLTMLSDTIGDDDEALAAIFPNVRAFRGMLTLVGENAENTTRIFGELAKATEGDLNEAFEATSKSAAFKFDQAMAGIQATLIELGSSILPVVLPVLQQIASAISSVVEWFTSLPEPVQQTVVQMLALLAAAGPLLSVGGRLIGTIGTMAGVFNKLGSVIGTVGAGPMAVFVAGALIVIEMINQIGRAANATNEELVDMAAKGLSSPFESAAATLELVTNGANRVTGAFIENQANMRAELERGARTLDKYNADVIATGQVSGDVTKHFLAAGQSAEVYASALRKTGKNVVVLDGEIFELSNNVQLLSEHQLEAARDAEMHSEQQDRVARAARAAGEAAGVEAGAIGDLAGEFEDGSQAAEEFAEMQALAEARLDELRFLMDGPVGEAARNYRDTQKDLSAQAVELRAKLAELEGQHGALVTTQKKGALTAAELALKQSQLVDANAKLAEMEDQNSTAALKLKVKIEDLSTALGGATGATQGYVDKSKEIAGVKDELAGVEEALNANKQNWINSMHEIALATLESKLAMDGLTLEEVQLLEDMAAGWGLVDEASRDASQTAAAAAAIMADSSQDIDIARRRVMDLYAIWEALGVLAQNPIQMRIEYEEQLGALGGELNPYGTENRTGPGNAGAGAVASGPALQHGGRLYPGVIHQINESGLTRPEVVVAPEGGWVLTRQQAMEALAGSGLQYVDNSVTNISDQLAARVFYEDKRRRRLEVIDRRMYGG